jgi:HemY protein
MLERPETAFLGLRGLLVQAQKADDTEAALHYARRAYELRPKTPWVLPAMFDLQVKLGNWVDALSSLDEAVRRRSVSQEDGRGRRVVVLLGCSDEAAKADDMRGAISYARKAYNQSPEFLPATIRLVGLMVEDDKLRPASRIIHNAWTREPHPELARIYGAMAPTEEAVKKVRRYERLLSFNPSHPESHIAVAEASLEAKLWGSARSHLESAAETRKTAKVCRLMADVEEAENNDSEAARRWLIDAATAEPQPAWLCAACGAAWAEWTPVCGRCGELGGQEWRIPMNAAQPTAIPAPGGKSLAAPDAAQTETENPKLTPTTSGAN